MSVYFVQCLENGLIKIGATQNSILGRMMRLCSHHADGEVFTLRLIGAMPGFLKEERAVQERFAHLNFRDFYPFHWEGYKPGVDLLDFIRSLPDCGEHVGIEWRVNPNRSVRVRRRCSHCRSPRHFADKCQKRSEVAAL